MRKYRNFETMDEGLKLSLAAWLKKSGVYYELSGVGRGWHFEILCNDAELEAANSFLDRYYAG